MQENFLEEAVLELCLNGQMSQGKSRDSSQQVSRSKSMEEARRRGLYRHVLSMWILLDEENQSRRLRQECGNHFLSRLAAPRFSYECYLRKRNESYCLIICVNGASGIVK